MFLRLVQLPWALAQYCEGVLRNYLKNHYDNSPTAFALRYCAPEDF